MVRPVAAAMSLEKVAVTSSTTAPSDRLPTMGKLAISAPVSELLRATSIGRTFGSPGTAPGTRAGASPGGGVSSCAAPARRFCVVLRSRTWITLPTRSKRASRLLTCRPLPAVTAPAGTRTSSEYQSSGLPRETASAGKATSVLPPLR